MTVWEFKDEEIAGPETVLEFTIEVDLVLW
jgi:hypothetical protein